MLALMVSIWVFCNDNLSMLPKMAIICARQANQNLRYPTHFSHIFCRLSFIRFYFFFSLQNLKVHFSFGFLGSIFNNNANELAIRLVILLVFRCSVYFHYIFTDDTILILITTFNLTFFYVYMEASLFSDWITLNTNLKEVCTEMWKIKTHSVKWTAITL